MKIVFQIRFLITIFENLFSNGFLRNLILKLILELVYLRNITTNICKSDLICFFGCLFRKKGSTKNRMYKKSIDHRNIEYISFFVRTGNFHSNYLIVIIITNFLTLSQLIFAKTKFREWGRGDLFSRICNFKVWKLFVPLDISKLDYMKCAKPADVV